MLSSVPRISRYIVLALFLLAILFFTWSPSSLPAGAHIPHGTWGNDEGNLKPQPPPASKPNNDGVDWSRFAYFGYATSEEHVCQAVMIQESLHRLGSKADRILLYPDDWRAEIEGTGGSNSVSEIKKLLITARDKYKVKLKPVTIQRRAGADPTWAAGYTKLLAFNQTEYSRVLSVDSDGNVMQTMDELFLLPDSVLAMPRAYWLSDENKTVLSNQMFLVRPSAFEWGRISKAMETKGPKDYDMDIMNKLYGLSCMVIPHRPYNCLSGEFKKGLKKPHDSYLGSDTEAWKPKEIFKEVKYLHYSDWPMRKPWYTNSEKTLEDTGPKCSGDGDPDCADREIWRGLYTDYAKRRKAICGLDLL